MSRTWWCVPVVPATREAEAGELLETGKRKLQAPTTECQSSLVAIVPRHELHIASLIPTEPQRFQSVKHMALKRVRENC
ncbi:hypothetical protein AAY473_030590 [Plecturocebus cupreus]